MKIQQTLTSIAFVLIIAISAVAFTAQPAQAAEDLANGFIVGMVCEDSNRNDICDMGELAKVDTPVYLQRVGEEVVGAMVAVTYTDSDGVFEFNNLEEGEYKIFAEEGAYAVVQVSGAKASNIVEIAFPVQMPTFKMFLPLTVGQ
jgi:hypothetical protein